jgi:hypothetical protein
MITTGITQKKAQASLRQNENAEPSVRMTTGQGARMVELSERIGNILRRVSKSLQPDNLSQIDRAEMPPSSRTKEDAYIRSGDPSPSQRVTVLAAFVGYHPRP